MRLIFNGFISTYHSRDESKCSTGFKIGRKDDLQIIMVGVYNMNTILGIYKVGVRKSIRLFMFILMLPSIYVYYCSI